jgi:hypothetical protein
MKKFAGEMNIWFNANTKEEVEMIWDIIYDHVEHVLCPVGEGQPMEEHECIRDFVIGGRMAVGYDSEDESDWDKLADFILKKVSTHHGD